LMAVFLFIPEKGKGYVAEDVDLTK